MSLRLASSSTPSSMQRWVSSLQKSGIQTLSDLEGVVETLDRDPGPQEVGEKDGEAGGELRGDVTELEARCPLLPADSSTGS